MKYLVLLAVLVLVVACGNSNIEPIVTVMPTEVPVVEAVELPTPEPTATAVPTETPTATPTETPEPTATPEPTPTAIPIPSMDVERQMWDHRVYLENMYTRWDDIINDGADTDPVTDEELVVLCYDIERLYEIEEFILSYRTTYPNQYLDILQDFATMRYVTAQALYSLSTLDCSVVSGIEEDIEEVVFD